MEDCHKNIVLIGGGHSNIQVLKILSQEWLYMKKNFGIKMRFTLISDHPTAFYSGMLPGYIAGMYNIDEIQIQLQPLCNWCGANFILDTAISIDEKEKIVYCKERNVKYDILSIDVGSTTKGMDIEGVKEFAICTRPLSNLLEKLENFEKEKNELNHIPKVIIVGGGAAGVELSFVFKARFMKKYKNVEVTLIDSNPVILEGLGSWVSNKVTSKLNEKNIKIQNSSYVQKITKETVFLSNEKQIPYDLIIWATGAAPPALNNGTNLEKDQYGFIRVLDTLQSISSPYIFVSGNFLHENK
jgi:selenide,water dikinase